MVICWINDFVRIFDLIICLSCVSFALFMAWSNEQQSICMGYILFLEMIAIENWKDNKGLHLLKIRNSSTCFSQNLTVYLFAWFTDMNLFLHLPYSFISTKFSMVILPWLVIALKVAPSLLFCKMIFLRKMSPWL